jgi:uncharacterized protein (UPF0276 family)
MFPELGIGLGLRPAHYPHILAQRPAIGWYEAISENYMGIRSGAGGKPLRTLEAIRRDHAVVLHGVSLSIGSVDALDPRYLGDLKTLADRIEPAWVSDHLCWTGVEGENLHDLLPLPFTEETLGHLVPRIARVQEFLGRRILLENVSSYLTYAHSELKEWEFLSELCRRADCGILLDVNNIYVSSVNQGFDPRAYLGGSPVDRVGQMHLAGHSRQGEVLIDTHDAPVAEPVWALYASAVERFGRVSTLIEWDAKIPEFGVLEAEARRAAKIQAQAHGAGLPLAQGGEHALAARG